MMEVEDEDDEKLRNRIANCKIIEDRKMRHKREKKRK